MFDELFPSTSAKFDLVPMSADTWVSEAENNRLIYSWAIWVLGCDLLTRAASYRSDGNLWEIRRFYARVSRIREEFAMARGQKKQDPILDNSKAEWKGFLDFRLNDELIAELDAWKPKPNEVWQIVDEAITAGYRFTLTYNNKLHLASCTMIDDSNTRPTGGYALSSFDTDGALALKMAIFKFSRLEHSFVSLMDKPTALGRRG